MSNKDDIIKTISIIKNKIQSDEFEHWLQKVIENSIDNKNKILIQFEIEIMGSHKDHVGFDIRNGRHNNFIDIIIPYENDLNRYIEHKCTNISNLIYKQIRNIVLRNNSVERCDMIDNDDIIGKYESTIAKYGYWIYFNK